MAETITKVPVKNAQTPPVGHPLRPFLGLRQEIERLFDEFDRGLWTSPFRRSLFEPFWRQEIGSMTAPAVDVAETEKAYEITAELPGLDGKNVEVKFADGILTIKGEKQEEKEEKKKDYYLSERSYGSFQRSFQVPDSVDPDKIEASFKNGVLTVTLPKNADSQKTAKKITVKAA